MSTALDRYENARLIIERTYHQALAEADLEHANARAKAGNVRALDLADAFRKYREEQAAESDAGGPQVAPAGGS